jgi:hypothetical protein
MPDPPDDALDDPSIPDRAALWRRIAPRKEWVIFDENLGASRATSAAFRDASLSVILGDEVIESGRTVAGLLIPYPNYGMVEFAAELARRLGQIVRRDPTPEEPAHALVAGVKTRKTSSAFAKAARWIVRPNLS